MQVALRLVFELLLKVLLAVALALLLQGRVERERLFMLLALAILARVYFLWREWRKPRPGDARWEKLEADEAALARADVEVYTGDAAAQGGSARERVDSDLKWCGDFVRWHARRTDGDLLSEALSLVTVAPCAFLLALMLTSPVVTWSSYDRGPASFALGAGIVLHFAANWIPATRPKRRVLARAILFVTMLVPTFLVAKERHPYLLASGEEHRRLIAERVWSLGFSIEAGRHAGLLVSYARDLEAERRWADAVRVYKRAVALDALLVAGHEGLARAHEALGNIAAASEARLAARAADDRKSANAAGVAVEAEVVKVDPLPAFDWRPAERLRVCLVPIGRVPDRLLDVAGNRLARELGVEVYRWTDTPPPLPEAGRKAGWLGNPQWSPVPLYQAFVDRMRAEEAEGRQARGAWQFLIVTDADLYAPDANFVFAVSFPVHGVVSFARFGDEQDAKRPERLAKQMMATAIKCFGVRQAGRADCVTAYVRSLDELDRKPMQPAEPTKADYLRRVAAWEANPRNTPSGPE
jgi:hypothetical protein